MLDAFTRPRKEQVVVDASESHRSDIGFGRANFTWSDEEDNDTLTPSRQRFRLCIDDEVKFKDGAINLIVGPTGSGKTSVLMALLGEMHYVPLHPDAWVNLPRTGGVAYAAQESWVQNATIKVIAMCSTCRNLTDSFQENILFGAPYDEERYKKGTFVVSKPHIPTSSVSLVIYQCGLTRDLSLFDAGDETEVGEKGLTLSGGQKVDHFRVASKC